MEKILVPHVGVLARTISLISDDKGIMKTPDNKPIATNIKLYY
jgi:hypothetical protein